MTMHGDDQKWTEDDDRSRAILDVRIAMKRHMGISTEGLTDDEVMLIFQRRMARFAEAVAPLVNRLRAAGVLPPEGDR